MTDQLCPVADDILEGLTEAVGFDEGKRIAMRDRMLETVSKQLTPEGVGLSCC